MARYLLHHALVVETLELQEKKGNPFVFPAREQRFYGGENMTSAKVSLNCPRCKQPGIYLVSTTKRKCPKCSRYWPTKQRPIEGQKEAITPGVIDPKQASTNSSEVIGTSPRTVQTGTMPSMTSADLPPFSLPIDPTVKKATEPLKNEKITAGWNDEFIKPEFFQDVFKSLFDGLKAGTGHVHWSLSDAEGKFMGYSAYAMSKKHSGASENLPEFMFIGAFLFILVPRIIRSIGIAAEKKKNAGMPQKQESEQKKEIKKLVEPTKDEAEKNAAIQSTYNKLAGATQ